MNRIGLLGFVMLVVSTACATNGIDSQQTMLPRRATRTFEAPSVEKTPSAAASSTSEPAMYATDTATARILQCSADDGKPQPSQGRGFPGALAYFDTNELAYIIVEGDPPTRTELDIPIENGGRLVGFSEDGKWLAYTTGSLYSIESTNIHLLEASGNEIVHEPNVYELLEPTDEYVVGSWGWPMWVGNTAIRVLLGNPSADHLNRKLTAFLDPFSGVWRQELLSTLSSRYEQGGVLPSPDMTRALFTSVTNVPRFRTDLVLWSYEKRGEIWKIHDFEGASLLNGGVSWNGPVSWSADSEFVAYTGPERPSQGIQPINFQGVFMLHRDGGDPLRVTQFLEWDGLEGFTADQLSWSPDSRYLAFAVTLAFAGNDEDAFVMERHLYVFDNMKGDLVKTCPLLGDSFRAVATALVWSPDSRYVSYVPSYSSADDAERPTPLVVIDLYEGGVYELAEFAGELVGWSRSFYLGN